MIRLRRRAQDLAEIVIDAVNDEDLDLRMVVDSILQEAIEVAEAAEQSEDEDHESELYIAQQQTKDVAKKIKEELGG